MSLPTFGVRVSPKGTKTFVVKIHNGRQAIGRYPIISLADARKQARRLLAEKTLGKIRPQAVTFSDAVSLFIEEKRSTAAPRPHISMSGSSIVWASRATLPPSPHMTSSGDCSSSNPARPTITLSLPLASFLIGR
jgi:hypothetical protein